MTIIVRSRDSLLTTTSGYTNYRGILNLVIILLVLSNARAALENVIKYGILVDPLSWLLFLGEGSKHWPALLIVLCLSGHILISLAVEKLIAFYFYSRTKTNTTSNTSHRQKNGAGDNKEDIPEVDHVEDDHDDEEKLKRSIHDGQSIMILANATIISNLIACISLPPITVYTNDTHPISTSGSLMIVSIVFLKLVSYHMMNYWCRQLLLPEKLRSVTTKSFLRLYISPAVDFGDELLDDNVNNNNNNNNNNNTISPKKVNELEKKENSALAPASAKGTQLNGHHANHHGCVDKEQIREISLKVLSNYPNNITLENIYHFMLYPTLCYELEYALTKRIRKRFLIKRLIELVILSQLDMALIQQWIVPTVSNSVTPFRQMQFSHMLERLLKLAIPNHVIWLIWFYLFFHSLLNIVAELTRFADREFYRDWWNSESVYYFWSNWNIPVHKWCTRHLYLPLISLGLSKCQASTAVFFVSAFFHEYLVSVPLKLFRMWAFTGMLIQLPWARFVSAYFNNHFANVAVWVSLIIGQPLCILMYYHDYYVISNVKSMPSR